MLFSDWKRYEDPQRWASYYEQVNSVLSFQPKSCLEIGVGNGIVGAALKGQGIELITLDIDPNLAPDHVASVESIPLPDNSVDIVLCAEVLEHLPYAQFEKCLSEISRVCRMGAVISLPHWGYTFRGIIDLPLLKFRFAIKAPWSTIIKEGGVHYWEIGRTHYPLQRITSSMKNAFDIQSEWLSPWMPYHHFFRLNKKR